MSELDRLIAQLEQTAADLRGGELDPRVAAELVERLAELAGQIGLGLDREARAATPDEPPGQETLL